MVPVSPEGFCLLLLVVPVSTEDSCLLQLMVPVEGTCLLLLVVPVSAEGSCLLGGPGGLRQQLWWKPSCCQNHRAADARQTFQNLENLEQLPCGSDGTTDGAPVPPKPPTFVDLAHDGHLQELPAVLFAVDPQQDSAQLGGQPEGGEQVEVRQRAQAAPQLLHGRHVLLGVLESQHVDD